MYVPESQMGAHEPPPITHSGYLGAEPRDAYAPDPNDGWDMTKTARLPPLPERSGRTSSLASEPPVAPPVRGGGTRLLVEENNLLDTLRTEFEQITVEVKELRLVIQQSTQELNRINQRNVAVFERVQEIDSNLEAYPRETIREAYLAASEAEMKAFMMSEQIDQMRAKLRAYERYEQFLKRTVDILSSLPFPGAAHPAMPQPASLSQPLAPQYVPFAQPLHASTAPPTAPLSTPLSGPLADPTYEPAAETTAEAVPVYEPAAAAESVPLYDPAPKYEPLPEHEAALERDTEPAYEPVRAEYRSELEVATESVPAPTVVEAEPAAEVTVPAAGDYDVSVLHTRRLSPEDALMPARASASGALRQVSTARIVEAEEQVRSRTAAVLQERLMQALVNLSLMAEICRKAVTDGQATAVGELDRLKTMIYATLQEAVRCMLELRPLSGTGVTELAAALERYTTAMAAEHHVPIEFSAPYGDRALPADRALAAFRIAQEAVENAIQHGRPTRIHVTLAFVSDGLILTVEDNGIGFNVDETLVRAANHQFSGLLSMLERAEVLGGMLRIHSTPGQGAQVELRAAL
jgi:NarL family two-component system sensor histidine kinase LiaS